MRLNLRLAHLVIFLLATILASLLYFGVKTFNYEQNSKTTKEAKTLPTRPVPTSEVQEVRVSPVVARDSTVNPSPEVLQATSQADLAKIAALENAIESAAKYKVWVDDAWKQLLQYKKEQLDCGERVRNSVAESIENGVALSPSQQRSLQQSCEDGYEPLISDSQRRYDEAFYQYNEYSRQINEILAECPQCVNDPN